MRMCEGSEICGGDGDIMHLACVSLLSLFGHLERQLKAQM